MIDAFLGFIFGKVEAGPAIGNIEEQLKELNFPVFIPFSITSVTEVIENGITLTKYLPVNVTKEYHLLFSKFK